MEDLETPPSVSGSFIQVGPEDDPVQDIKPTAISTEQELSLPTRERIPSVSAVADSDALDTAAAQLNSATPDCTLLFLSSIVELTLFPL
jgi:hypothetical protein